MTSNAGDNSKCGLSCGATSDNGTTDEAYQAQLAAEAAEKARLDSIAAAEAERARLAAERAAHIAALKEAGESVTVHFETGGADLKFKPEEQPIIDEICAVMAEDSTLHIVITGHTDNTGDANQNLKVWGKKRAEALYRSERRNGYQLRYQLHQRYADGLPGSADDYSR